MLKRTNWTNDEVIKILEGRKIAIEMDDAKTWDQKRYDRAVTYNHGIDQAINQFWDFKADPKESYSAMAYDTELERIFVISEPMPQ